MFSFSSSIVINRLKTPKSWNVYDGLEQEPSHYPLKLKLTVIRVKRL